MVTIFRLTLIVFALCAAAAGVTHWMAIQQPVPIMAVFSNPNGTPCERPCLFGVQPGLTPFDHARDLLRAHPFTSQFESNLEGDIFRQGSMRIIIAWGLGNDRVSSIELFTTNSLDLGSLGQVVVALGPPERVLVDGDNTCTFWYAGQLEVVSYTYRQADRLTPNDALESISIRMQPNDLQSSAVPWQGFSSVERYAAAKS